MRPRVKDRGQYGWTNDFSIYHPTQSKVRGGSMETERKCFNLCSGRWSTDAGTTGPKAVADDNNLLSEPVPTRFSL